MRLRETSVRPLRIASDESLYLYFQVVFVWMRVVVVPVRPVFGGHWRISGAFRSRSFVGNSSMCPTSCGCPIVLSLGVDQTAARGEYERGPDSRGQPAQRAFEGSAGYGRALSQQAPVNLQRLTSQGGSVRVCRWLAARAVS